jgi:hypothetical protein
MTGMRTITCRGPSRRSAARRRGACAATDAALHYAVYQFADADEIERALTSEPFRELVADYDRRWPTGVTRTREIVTVLQEMAG